MSPRSRTLAWKIPWTEEPGRLQSMGSLGVGHDWVTSLDTTERHHFHFSLSCIGEGNGKPLQCSCLENPRDGGAWWAAIYWVSQSQTRLKWLSNSSSRSSAYTLNNQGDNIQPWHTPFPIWYQSFVPCPVLTVPSWPTYRFLRRQVRWSGILLFLRIFHSLLWSTESKALAYQWSRSRCFSGILLLFLWPNRCWQFDLWLLCLF